MVTEYPGIHTLLVELRDERGSQMCAVLDDLRSQTKEDKPQLDIKRFSSSCLVFKGGPRVARGILGSGWVGRRIPHFGRPVLVCI